ncbi:patatin-like phospholipase family protein [Sphingomonas zeicaulis]|uniref:patatin-like phospholipase family protein n=1 Tax=Sphingomonas zeicaulis TaxID=1632740 RepID=UPI003D24B3E4
MIAGFSQRRGLLAPCPPGSREAVEKHDERSAVLTRLDDMQIEVMGSPAGFPPAGFEQRGRRHQVPTGRRGHRFCPLHGSANFLRHQPVLPTPSCWLGVNRQMYTAPPFADHRFALVLSGGNALGSFQAGAWCALEQHGLVPDWIAGASVGAVNGAIICGNPPGERRAALERLWRPALNNEMPTFDLKSAEEARRVRSAISSLAFGQPGLFNPRALYGPWFNPFGNLEPSSLYDALPLEATLEKLVDFERLNGGATRYFATAVDIDTGEDVLFDSAKAHVAPEHIRASAALLPVYSPVEIGGRLLGDAGISINLPLDVVLAQPQDKPLLCIAIDLLPLRAPRPLNLGETLTRAQDLMFATQSRRAIAAWQALFAERARQGDAASVTLLHLAYANQADEVSLKAFDFSPKSAARRWRAGFETVDRALEQLSAPAHALGQPGLAVLAPDDQHRLASVQWGLAPLTG